MEKLAYSVEELAEVIGVGKNCAYDLCKREDFPVIRIGDRRLIIPADGLRAWLEKQTNTKGGAT